eukprot:TRINITY_DN20809_c0_g2_i1.p1 TRINITY_DN20809_c0_g2~~TRINITY_DN20809_c0_g2_i1.p1  ORF type:complete len:805 (-),score=208.11 TRINITY_DN20809_c0_g2_i1:176-2590(-)
MDRSMLNKATSSDDIPTPGYLFTEIAKCTFTDLAASQQLADYLLKKLEKDDPRVKCKVLRIIRHVCEQGKADFRRAVQKRSEVVKGCLQYRGTPDPLKGDSMNKQVREEADAAVKAVFSSDSATNAYGGNLEASRKMQGFGSEGHGGGDSFVQGRIGQLPSQSGGGMRGFGSDDMGGGGGGMPKGPSSMGSGGMVGFGNPNFDNAPKEDKDSMFSQAMSSGWTAVSSLTNKVSQVSGMGTQSRPGQTGGGYGGYGGGPGGMDSNMSSYRAPPVGGAQTASFGQGVQGRWGGDSSAAAAVSSRATSSSTTGEYEARIVEALCAPGGPRVAPSKDALEDFCKKCESLDCTAVADQLRKKLLGTEWQIRLKALHAIEALNNHGLDGIVGPLQQHCSDLLFEAQELPQCKQKATQVLSALGLVDASSVTAARRGGSAAAAAPAAPPVDLLDMMDGGSPAAAAMPTNGASAAPNLLEASPAVNGSGGGLLDFGAPDAGAVAAPMQAPPAAGGAGGGGGLFGSLSIGGSQAPAPAETPSLLAQVQGQPGGVGGPSPEAQAGGGSSLFSGLSARGSATGQAAGMQQAGSGLPGAFGSAMQPPAAQQQDRGAHLSILSGLNAGGTTGQMPGMQQQMPQMGGGCMPQMGGMGMGGMGVAGGMQQPQQAYGGCMGGGCGGMPQMAPMGQMGAQPPYPGGGCGGCMPQMGGGMMGGMGMGGCGQMQNMGGPCGGPGPAFGFVGGAGGPSGPSPMGMGGGCGNMAPPMMGAPGQSMGGIGQLQPSLGMSSQAAAPKKDSAFGFVADEMMGLKGGLS